MFTKILIANRGEIAVRIMRTCREMGIRTVAVYSDADKTARHVREADEAYYIGAAPANQSYLDISNIISVARRSGAEAIHPGYGFLSENPSFAEACEKAGLVFIGPPASAMHLMGSKIAAKQVAQSVNAPTVPGYLGANQDDVILMQEAERIGFPLLIKASAGGGGKGMRSVFNPEEFMEQAAGARREARAAFGDATVFLEKLLVNPRHIEIQVLGDNFGHLVHLGERDCSIQRRHQKIVEESPSTIMTSEMREEMGASAVRIARAAGYVNAGTVEFITDQEGHYYFLEMNTRLQVEHPVTELVTGLDLVRWQLMIAAGQPLTLRQEEIRQHGHAIEVRLYAEDPSQNFMPSTGTINGLHLGEGPGMRIDSGVETSDTISPYYDSMIAKIIAYGENRAATIARLQRSLEQTTVFGINTNLPLLLDIVRHPAFKEGAVHTGFLTEHNLIGANKPAHVTDNPELETVMIAAALFETHKQNHEVKPGNPWQTLGPWRMVGWGRAYTYIYNDHEYKVEVQANVKSKGGWEVRLSGEHKTPIIETLECSVFQDQISLTRSDNSHQNKAFVNLKNPSSLQVSLNGETYRLDRRTPPEVEITSHTRVPLQFQKNLTAPMAGMVAKISVQEGDEVEAHQVLVILEAMKMELPVTSPQAGKVKRLNVKEKMVVEGGAILVELE